MKKNILIFLVFLSFNLLAQVRTIPPIDQGAARFDSLPMRPVLGITWNEKDYRDYALLQNKLLKLDQHLKSNWRECISLQSRPPKNILDAYVQMTFMLTPRNGQSKCDSLNETKVDCLVQSKDYKKVLKEVKRMDITKKLEVIDTDGKKIFTVDELAKQLNKMTRKIP